jgi:hypothetical protein
MDWEGSDSDSDSAGSHVIEELLQNIDDEEIEVSAVKVE